MSDMSDPATDLFVRLAGPFEKWEVKQRSQGGRTFSYVTARTIQNRLDDVLGPQNWWAEFEPHENSVLCKLTVRLPDGRHLTKADAGGHAGMADSGDDEKSGYSDSLKRAAVMFGVGRYLYGSGVPAFARHLFGEVMEDHQAPPARDRMPSQGRGPSEPQPDRRPPQGQRQISHGDDRIPETGSQLFAWVKKQEERYEVGLLKYLNQWAKLQELPARLVDFDADQVVLAHREATRKLASLRDREEAVSNN